jgi:hypothetical protein
MQCVERQYKIIVRLPTAETDFHKLRTDSVQLTTASARSRLAPLRAPWIALAQIKIPSHVTAEINQPTVFVTKYPIRFEVNTINLTMLSITRERACPLREFTVVLCM